MRAGRMTWSVLLVVGALAVMAAAAAQAETDDGAPKLVERPYTAILEIFMLGVEYAGEVPFEGEPRDFDGLCSVPADLVWRTRMAGIDSVFGHFEGTGHLCAQVEWGVDASGAPAMVGMGYSDLAGTYALPDGSSIGIQLIATSEAYDEDTGHLTSGVVVIPWRPGTGRYEGATLFGVMNCRWASAEALMAGIEPELCAMHGTIRYDPFAGSGD